MGLGALHDAIVVTGVHKWYRVYATPGERLKRLVGRRSRHLDFRALEDVSFAVAPGTAVGIIGENGAGKSTLLKIIAGTTSPTAGEVEVRGVVAAILELGAAFHPEFSGRDNAILYGALMGLDREDMVARLEAIFDFAELGEFIEHPVKSYSTGMAMRLAFAVATHVDPDVLVVDEALAVLPLGGGDESWADRFGRDVVGNSVSVVVLALLLLTVIAAPIMAIRGSRGSSKASVRRHG